MNKCDEDGLSTGRACTSDQDPKGKAAICANATHRIGSSGASRRPIPCDGQVGFAPMRGLKAVVEVSLVQAGR